jgi:hypothetical protein
LGWYWAAYSRIEGRVSARSIIKACIREIP